MSTRTVIPFSPLQASHRSRASSVMLAPQSRGVPPRSLLSPGHPKEGLLQDEPGVEVGLVGERRSGLLHRTERAGGPRRVAGLVQVHVDARRGVAACRREDPIAQDRRHPEQHPVDEVPFRAALLAVVALLEAPDDAPISVLYAAPVVGELPELLVERLLESLAIRGAR